MLPEGVSALKMPSLNRELRRLLDDDSGPTATEYAVMLALIVVVCIGSVALMGQSLSDNVFGTVNTLFGGS